METCLYEERDFEDANILDAQIIRNQLKECKEYFTTQKGLASWVYQCLPEIDRMLEQCSIVDEDLICYVHGDVSLYNIIYTNKKQPILIDYGRCGLGRRFYEFLQMGAFTYWMSAYFSMGQIHGYFRGEPPECFWQIIEVYLFHDTIYSYMNYCNQMQEDNVVDDNLKYLVSLCGKIYTDYDAFRNKIPTWYRNVKKECHEEKNIRL